MSNQIKLICKKCKNEFRPLDTFIYTEFCSKKCENEFTDVGTNKIVDVISKKFKSEIKSENETKSETKSDIESNIFGSSQRITSKLVSYDDKKPKSDKISETCLLPGCKYFKTNTNKFCRVEHEKIFDILKSKIVKHKHKLLKDKFITDQIYQNIIDNKVQFGEILDPFTTLFQEILMEIPTEKINQTYLLTNNAESKFTVDLLDEKVDVASVENLYQCIKYLNHSIATIRKVALFDGNIIGLGKKAEIKPNAWQKISIDVMKYACGNKFMIKKFSDSLLETDDSILIYADPFDTFWGGLNVKKDTEIVVGKNTLGIILMEIRSKIKEKPNNVALIEYIDEKYQIIKKNYKKFDAKMRLTNKLDDDSDNDDSDNDSKN